jgi:hypothetical protein
VRLDLATPDARHRRPLKFFLYHPSEKATLVPKGKVSFKNDVVVGATKTAGVVARKSALEQDVPFLSII